MSEYGNILKLALVNNRHMRYVGKNGCMTDSYIGRCMRKWIKTLFFHLLQLSVLNSFILFKTCGSKLIHQTFGLALVMDQTKGVCVCPSWPQTILQEKTFTRQKTWLEIGHSEHWPSKGKSFVPLVFHEMHRN
jgi:hypothetical protein